MTFVIQPIVEGFGEEQSIRTLICRIGSQYSNLHHVEVLTPMNTKGSGNLKTKLETFVEYAADKIRQSGKIGGVLILLDSDSDCPAQNGPALLYRASQQCQHLRIPVSVVMAHCEYEAWFLAAASSLSEVGTLPARLSNHPTPEEKRNAKEWLNEQMTDKYSERRHQPAFTTVFDLPMARAGAPSFDKLCRDLERMFQVLQPE